jgi:FkbM family methyltransferase
MKKFINRQLQKFGYQIVHKNDLTFQYPSESSYSSLPIGRMDSLLADLKSRGLTCNTILDVGANITDWSRMAIRIFPTANFFLIEPQIELKSNLDSFCSEYPNSGYFLGGAGAHLEQRLLTLWDDLAGSSFLPYINEDLVQAGKQRLVDIVTIDELITTSKLAIPELIKLDIQGFELEALKGAEMTFGYTEVYILEVSLFSFSDVPGQPEFAEVVEFMKARHYVVYDFPGFLRRPYDGALGQCDVCFVKENGFLRTSNDWR